MPGEGKYSSVTVAKFIVAKANEREIAINITKTQKLLYIAYGAYLVIKKKRLTDEQPQAWPFGPVFPNTRKVLLGYAYLTDITLNDPSLSKIKEDKEMISLTDFVLDEFGTWTAHELTEWSHQDDSPWGITVCDDDFRWGDCIPDGAIVRFFSNIIVPQTA